MSDVLSHPRFQDEQAAYDWVEAHLWPDGPVCPRCGGLDRITKLQGKSTRIGTYKCKDCRKPFTVKVGTIFEDSHIPMRMWLQAIALLCASKKGISSNQLHRMTGHHPQVGVVHVAQTARGDALWPASSRLPVQRAGRSRGR